MFSSCDRRDGSLDASSSAGTGGFGCPDLTYVPMSVPWDAAEEAAAQGRSGTDGSRGLRGRRLDGRGL